MKTRFWLSMALALGAAHAQAVPDVPPVASLISLSAPDSSSNVTVTGAAGAVAGGSYVYMVNLDSSDFAPAQAKADGSFTGSIFGPPGTSIMIKADPSGRVPNDSPPHGADFLPLVGTILRVGDPANGGAGLSFGGAGLVNPQQPALPPIWTFQGVLSARTFQPGDTIRVTGTLAVSSQVLLQSTAPMSAQVAFGLERLTGPDGSAVLDQNVFASTNLTATGLPMERTAYGNYVQGFQAASLAVPGEAVVSIPVNVSLQLPASLPAGYFRPFLDFNFHNVPIDSSSPRVLADVNPFIRGLNPPNSYVYAPVIRFGSAGAPRLPWLLLADTLSNGSRGVRAAEDQTRFGLSQRILTESETFIVPRLDPTSGKPATYRLEPFAPTIAAGDRGDPPNFPLVAFQFPSGSLTVQVQKPDGTTQTLGPAPFVQSRLRGLTDSNGKDVYDNGPRPGDIFQLSTLDPRFNYQFPQDGRYVITVTGSIDDIWGNTWTGGGTYQIYVARILSLDTAVLPGTPFQTGDVFNPGLVVTPPVPAAVDVRFTLAPNSDPKQITVQTADGFANRFGYFFPGGGIPLNQPGEYRVDTVASYTDANGNLWMGSRTWGSVVAPPNPRILVHGFRGVDFVPTLGSQWFFRTQTGEQVGQGDQHMLFPFNSGDVLWAQKSDVAVAMVSFQDPSGAISSLVSSREGHPNAGPQISESQATAAGQTSLQSSRPDGQEISEDPSKVDIWAYTYCFVERPLVRVREYLGEDGVIYWRFTGEYGEQIGAGPQGDLPNDFKFLYGGVVIRGSAVPSSPVYGIYGSLFVLVPDSDPNGGSRVFPPFEGNGGGPSGGPIMTLNGRKIDLFLHLTGVRPGSVLETGDTFTMAGAVAPTLPALVSYTVTSPSGVQTSYSGRANPIGYYYHPADDFTIRETGIYTVNLTVTYDGLTSAGPVTQPFPTGDVLGTANGQFSFYAVAPGSAPLAVNLAADSTLAPPINLNVNGSAPTGMTLTGGHMTATMPGFVLQTGALTPASGQISYNYNLQTLAKSFPNLDQPAPADVVTITLFGSGTGSDGKPAYAARLLALQAAELFNFAETPVAPAITGVTNAEGGAGVIAPNTWVSINGTNLAPDGRTWGSADFVNDLLPQSLDGVSVTMNGKSAYLYYISPTQINVLTPPDLSTGPLQVVVTVNGVASAPFAAQAQTVSPSFFVLSGPYVLATHADGSLIGPATLYPGATTPAQAGETVVVYANGLGPVSPPVVSGSESQSGALNPLPEVTVGGTAANVSFAGLISPGLYQINLVVPGGAAAGDNPISVSVGSALSQAGALITVR